MAKRKSKKKKKTLVHKVENKGDEEACYILFTVTMETTQLHFVKDVGHLKARKISQIISQSYLFPQVLMIGCNCVFCDSHRQMLDWKYFMICPHLFPMFFPSALSTFSDSNG